MTLVYAGEAEQLRTAVESSWRDTATVYTRAGNGQYTVIAKSGLRCSVERLNLQNVPSMQGRAELAAGRVLKWDATYTMPDNAQLEIDGRRWNLRKDTILARRAPGSATALYWMADMQRVP